jgi:MinD-like ATPase involved in chromosome partitioning or flagellar assembly
MQATHIIPHDVNVGPSIQTGMPIVDQQPNSRFTRSVLEIAQQVTGVGSPEPARHLRFPLQRMGLFGRRA